MSKPQILSDRFVKGGRFRLQKQILDTASMVEFVADEIAADGGNARQVALTMLRFGFRDEARDSLMRSLSLLRAIVFRTFPAIREIHPEQESGLLVISDYWRTARPLSEVIDEAKNSRIEPDLTFALYVLKSMCSAVSLLHECRVSDFKTIHGALSPQTVWIDSAGNLRCRNHFFGLALAHQQGHSPEEASDVRGLGEVFWNLVSHEGWSGAEPALMRNRGGAEKRILEASGLLPGFGRPTVCEFADVVDEVLASGAYYATQKYASHWLGHKRLPAEPSWTRTKKPATGPAPRPGGQQPQHGTKGRRSILPWIVGIIVLTMAAVFGIVRFLVQP